MLKRQFITIGEVLDLLPCIGDATTVKVFNGRFSYGEDYIFKGHWFDPEISEQLNDMVVYSFEYDAMNDIITFNLFSKN